jgi:hypothetical protein
LLAVERLRFDIVVVALCLPLLLQKSSITQWVRG